MAYLGYLSLDGGGVLIGARKIFSRGRQIMGLGMKVPQQGPGMEPQ